MDVTEEQIMDLNAFLDCYRKLQSTDKYEVSNEIYIDIRDKLIQITYCKN